MVHEIYRNEMNQEPYCSDYSNPWGKYNDDYVHWLERNMENRLKTSTFSIQSQLLITFCEYLYKRNLLNVVKENITVRVELFLKRKTHNS